MNTYCIYYIFINWGECSLVLVRSSLNCLTIFPLLFHRGVSKLLEYNNSFLFSKRFSPLWISSSLSLGSAPVKANHTLLFSLAAGFPSHHSYTHSCHVNSPTYAALRVTVTLPLDFLESDRHSPKRHHQPLSPVTRTHACQTTSSF